MADGSDQLALSVDAGDELVGFGMAADVVWGEASGGDDAVEIVWIDVLVAKLGDAGISQFAGVGFAGLGTDRDHFDARFLQAIERIPNLHFLVHLVD